MSDYLMLEVTGVLLMTPIVVYLTVKLGVYGFLQGKANFESDQERKKNEQEKESREKAKAKFGSTDRGER